MNMKRLSAFILSAFMLFGSAALAAPEPTATPEPTPYPYSGEYGAFEEIAEAVSELYIDESYTKEKVMIGGVADLLSDMLENNEPLLVEVLKKTLESLDDYSEFYTPEEYKAFQEQLNYTFYGIGVSIRMGEDGYVEVTDFAEGSDNAEKAGFMVGDKLYKVNGEDLTGMSLDEVRSRIVGEEGTTVDVTVLRNGRELTLTAARVAINSATVYDAVLSGNIGYIRILTFGEDTADEFKKALDYMREKKVRKIILDLRNNVGGHVAAAVSIAQSIVPKGKVIDVKFRQPKYNMTYNSTLSKKEFDFAVLVNDHTASASEILASSIQDSGAGKLIGTQTFGKAVIQNTYPLSNGSMLKLTTGQYITRNGNEINHVGLTPNTYVENETTKLDLSEYTQFDYKTRTALGEKSENVRAAKERLQILGYYNGELDDVFDVNLYDAIKIFQQTNALFGYGIIDIPTQKLMDEYVSEIEVMKDTQLEEAYKYCGGDIKKLYNE